MYLKVPTSHADVEAFVEVFEAGQECRPRKYAEEKGQEVKSRAHIVVDRHRSLRGVVYSILMKEEVIYMYMYKYRNEL